jgi:multidrug efflux system outer membrane protein
MTRLTSSIALSSLLLGACAVGPTYHAPAVAPVRISNAGGAAFEERTPAADWWQEFQDPELDSLVRRALGANLDLRVAVDRVRAARAVFVERNFDYAPHVSAAGGYTHSNEQVPGFGTARVDVESASLGFDASWELDLFGRVRRSVEAAKGDLGTEQASYRDVEVTVTAEVARNYFELRGAQKQLAVARGNLGREGQSLELTQLREQAGRGAELDVQRSIARLKATEAAIPPLEAAEKQAAYRLAVLLGQRPGTLDDELGPKESPVYARALPIADPSALLRQRPDVRIAERQLAAATARVGVATADLFPRVSVTGFIGFLSGDVNRLFGTTPGLDTHAWSVSPTVSWAAFDLGSVRARLRASRAQADGKRQEQLKSLSEQADASRRAADIAEIQYREGVSDYLALLDAQRTEFDAENAVAQAETAVNVAVVGIYKALGGIGAPEQVASDFGRTRGTTGASL